MALSDTELALVDAIKSIAEVLMAMHPRAAAALAASFRHQENLLIQAGRQDAALVLGLLQRFAADPARQAEREQVRRVISEPPQGQA